MSYRRSIYARLESEIPTDEIVVITGMRRVGKTTALKHLYDLIDSDNKVMFDLENPLHRKLFEEENYDTVWHNLRQFNIVNSQKVYIFLDEVQNLPEISTVVKYLYDHWHVKFFLTGSSSYYLRNLFPESLAGRKLVFEMFPLTFTEFLTFKVIEQPSGSDFAASAASKNEIGHARLLPEYQEYIQFGGFPSVVLEEKYSRKKDLLAEIFTSYFEKDAKNLSDFKDMSKLRDLILLLIPRIGSKVDVAKLSSVLAVSRETIYQYLAFLEQTYFIKLLPQHSGSPDRQAAGSRKLYLCDSGIAGALGDPSAGQLFEQSVFQNIRQRGQISFFAKSSGAEIDFIVDGKVALEVKVQGTEHDVSVLNTRAQALALAEAYIVSLEYADDPGVVLATDLR